MFKIVINYLTTPRYNYALYITNTVGDVIRII